MLRVNWAVCQPAPCSACTEPTGNPPEQEAACTAAVLAIASPFSLDSLHPGLQLMVNFTQFSGSRCVCRFASPISSSVIYPHRPTNGRLSSSFITLPEPCFDLLPFTTVAQNEVNFWNRLGKDLLNKHTFNNVPSPFYFLRIGVFQWNKKSLGSIAALEMAAAHSQPCGAIASGSCARFSPCSACRPQLQNAAVFWWVWLGFSSYQKHLLFS